ncbi:MAG: hypothetical protein RR956_07525 [Christensenella sp.]
MSIETISAKDIFNKNYDKRRMLRDDTPKVKTTKGKTPKVKTSGLCPTAF